MGRKSIILFIAMSVLILSGWAINHFYSGMFSPAKSADPEPEPACILPPSTNMAPDKIPGQKPADISDSAPRIQQEQPIAPQHVKPDKVTTNGKSPNLADYDYLIKKDEKKGIVILPGVTYKAGVVNVQLDKNSDKCVEFERNPANSNNQYQMMWRSKF